MRREGNSKDYVTDGLILHLDAIKNASGGTHSNSTTTWYDLSASANNVSLVNPSWSDTYLTFGGSTRGQTASNVNLNGLSKFTIEVLFRTITNSTLGIILEHTSNYNTNIGAFLLDTVDGSPATKTLFGGLRKNAQSGKHPYLTGGYDKSISDDLYVMQYDDSTDVATTELEMYTNTIKETLTFNPNNDATVATTLRTAILYIGARSGGSFPFTGSIRAIRIYNRKLSVAELYQNKITDFRRYGIIK